MSETDQEKTEDATEHRIQKYRDEGRVATSKELISAVILCVGGGSLLASMGLFADGFHTLIQTLQARMGDNELTVADANQIGMTVITTIGAPLAIVLTAVTLATVLASFLVTNFNFSTEALEPKFDRLDPLTNFKNQFMSSQPWIQLLKGSVVAAAVGWAAWTCMRDHVDALPVVASLDMRGQASFLAELCKDFLTRVAPVAIAVGAADFGWQRYKHAESMKMTKQEVKEEHKEQEGDPLIKGKRRQRQRQIALGQMLHKVKEADLVIVNPTHYAIAIRYRKEEGKAPVVLARGVDHLALKIRAEAARNEIPVIENRPLARALYAKARLGLPIPAEFYGAVAQLLAAVYRRRAAGRAGGTPRVP